jgi:ferredoxin
MKVNVDLDLCEAHGECVLAAAEVFALDDDENLSWESEPDASLREKVEAAARVCPVQAISID